MERHVMKTKLEIVGPYTPEHEGPFCTREKVPVELMFRNGRGVYPVAGYIGDHTRITEWSESGAYYVDDQCDNPKDLMNAREVPVAREFWINEYTDMISVPYIRKDAAQAGMCAENYIRTIHVREVLPGEGA